MVFTPWMQDLTALKNQIIGIVPFSYAAADRFQAARDHQDETQLLRALFDDNRIAFRFRMLELLNAHSLKTQGDRNFSMIYLVSERMPPEHRRRLEEIVSDVPGVRIVALPQMPLADAVRRAFEQVIDPQAEHVSLFRLDDDDALAVDFVGSLRRRARRLINAGLIQKPTVLSSTRGVYWKNDGKGRSQLIDICDRVPLSMGYTIVSPRDEIGHHYLKGHRDAAMFYPCFIDPSRIMYVRSVHGDNDGGISNLNRGQVLAPDRARQILRRRFDLDADLLLAPEGALAGKAFSQRAS
ncbi:putative rhamnosyl transferase [Leisingera aquaemixtae]|uniref:glycosyltransferase n=1 Tax=Leisingera aquaemixtae TaxID=1396826 RepID=UPI001C979FB4|nr:glycosyltransferase [Leisingera aquaemixtae]MBY6069080.1 putative rhamnosyl transferase [Leisingera aquaemixtae]